MNISLSVLNLGHPRTNTPGHRGRRLSLFGKLVILSSYCSKKRFNNGLQVWKIKGKDPPNSILNFFEICENPVESLNMIIVELGDDLFIVFERSISVLILSVGGGKKVFKAPF
ncbi:hypothetical protein Tco_0680888 [Tanacetum coccineum]|uniref:Uncharacterized protein n=1 Tax=Tanacetum coccineum TaxID=301880 RepID=A0ABQ4XLS9_9ASTR